MCQFAISLTVFITVFFNLKAQPVLHVTPTQEGSEVAVRFYLEQAGKVALLVAEDGENFKPAGQVTFMKAGSNVIRWAPKQIVVSDLVVFRVSWTADFGYSETRMLSIGKQSWVGKNLNVDHFSNGDPIPEARTTEEWQSAINNKEAAWCYFNNEPENGKLIGRLYNQFAVADRRGLCPAGWHIPTDQEWMTLFQELGEGQAAASRMKTLGGWKSNGNGTNSSGFTATPSGCRHYSYDVRDHVFFGLGSYAFYWSSTDEYSVVRIGSEPYLSDADAHRMDTYRDFGASVRCLNGEDPKVKAEQSALYNSQEETDEIFTIVEESAAPKEGMAAFYKYIGSKLKYPSQATRMGVEGKVFVEFVINRDGTLVDVKVVRGLGAGCDEEAVRVVQSSPPWKPGKQRGKFVRQKYTLPIQFKLQ